MGISKRIFFFVGIGAVSAWMIFSTLFLTANALGVVSAADRSPNPTPPPCNMDTKAGYIELNPSGTISATTLITFSTPFCSSNYVLGANLVTPFVVDAERPAPTVRLYTPSVASVTIWLEDESELVYKAHWIAVQETQ